MIFVKMLNFYRSNTTIDEHFIKLFVVHNWEMS